MKQWTEKKRVSEQTFMAYNIQMPIPGYIPRPIFTTTPKVEEMSPTTQSQYLQTDPTFSATSPTHSEIHHAIKNHIYKR